MDAASRSMVFSSTTLSSVGPSRSLSGTGMPTSCLHAHRQRQADRPGPAGEVVCFERVVQLVERLPLVDGALGAYDRLAVDPDAVDRVHDLVGRTGWCRRELVHLVQVAAVEGGVAFEQGEDRFGPVQRLVDT